MAKCKVGTAVPSRPLQPRHAADSTLNLPIDSFSLREKVAAGRMRVNPRMLFREGHCLIVGFIFCFLSSSNALKAQVIQLGADSFSGPDFQALVRKAKPLSSQESLKLFDVPAGFRMELVAASPDIGQPMNLAFDERGRLWVTSTLEYPYPAPLGQPGRDTIKILEDTNGDGAYDKLTTFADGLNIPTGLYPYKDGVIAWSIPNIWFLRDTDGDGRADKREKLYGPLGFERDTHGMHSSFTRGLDGWLHLTHGFNNTTTVNAADGSSITMHSGNTYRVRLDGSSVEQFTFGQVNPFGMCLDSFGNFYTADCHSSPIYQLIHDAYYPSFGKPHDGMGFAPTVIRHTHNSSGLCGIVFNQDNHWPAEFRDNIFIGNVVTSRVNRDKIRWRGSSPKGTKLPDLVRTADPWFRPVNLQFGPDGALYIADFYNRIIGHYEVRLDHPGRDREMGRIWRLVYDGPNAEPLPKPVNLPGATLGQAISELANPLLSRRMTATDYLADDVGQRAAEPLGQAMVRAGAAPELRAHGAWVLHRLGQLDEATQLRLANDNSELVRVHARRIAAAQKNWPPKTESIVLAGLHDDSPQVRRAAADALARQPRAGHIRPLLTALGQAPATDGHLRHALRIALRNNLRAVDHPGKFADLKDDSASLRELMSVALSVNSPFVASLLLANLHDAGIERGQLTVYLRHIARNAPPEGLDRLAAVVQKQFPGSLDFQSELLLAINDGIVQRGLTPERGVLGWAENLAGQLLAAAEPAGMHWVAEPAKGVPPSEIPWVVQTRSIPAKPPKWKKHPHPEHPTASPWVSQVRASSDGVAATRYITSLPPGGESLTGVLRSVPFAMPAELTFFINGHRGFPNDPAHDKNFVRLVDAKTGGELHRVYPPRNDTGVPVRWQLDRPREVYIEVVDGDTGAAFAWLGVVRFNVGLELFRQAKFLSSQAPGGDHLTGVLRSREFAVPGRLRFLLAGHSGRLGKPPSRKKYVQLVEAGSGRILQKTGCSSGETAQEIVWDLSAFAGRRVRLEIVDRDTAGGFAWVAAGGFEPPIAPLPTMAPRRLAKRQLAAAQIVRDLKLTTVLDGAARLATDPFAVTAAREMAVSAILGQGNASQRSRVAAILEDGSQPESLRLAVANGGAHLPVVRAHLAKALGQAPADLQLQFARALARNRPGAKALLGSVESGLAPAGLLLDPQIKSSFPEAAAGRVAALTADLPKPNANRERLIAERVAAFRETGGDTASGRTTFATFCAACHQKGGQGGSIGPQLDGVSNRGVERLVEDILDPNRNVDVAFRYSIVKLKNGQTVLGLKRREVGESIVFADLAGAESSIAKADIVSQEQTTRSLMPEAIGQAIPPADFRDMLEFLLAK